MTVLPDHTEPREEKTRRPAIGPCDSIKAIERILRLMEPLTPGHRKLVFGYLRAYAEIDMEKQPELFSE